MISMKFSLVSDIVALLALYNDPILRSLWIGSTFVGCTVFICLVISILELISEDLSVLDETVEHGIIFLHLKWSGSSQQLA